MFRFGQRRQDPRKLVGVSLTDAGVALASLSRDGDTAFTISCIDYVDYESIEQMSQQLHHWVQQHQLKNRLTNFVLGPHQFTFVLTETPEVPAEELTTAMHWKSKELLGMEMEEIVLDCLSIPGQRERGRQAMAYVIAADIDVLRSYARVIETSELSLSSIDIPATVQRNIAHLIPEDKHGVALLSLNHRGGLLTLTRQGEVYLARDLEVGYANFEQTTQVDESDIALEGLPASIQSSLDAIVLEVQRSIDYYERYFAQPPIQSVVIAPMEFEVTGMVEYIASQLGLQVRELDLNPLLSLNEPMARQKQSQCLTAIGAALRWPVAS